MTVTTLCPFRSEAMQLSERSRLRRRHYFTPPATGFVQKRWSIRGDRTTVKSMSTIDETAPTFAREKRSTRALLDSVEFGETLEQEEKEIEEKEEEAFDL